MRWFLVLCAAVCLGCDDEDLLYADGTAWQNVSLSPGRVIPRDMDARAFDRWAMGQQAMPHRDVRTFTPTWSGFSVDPVGDLSYIDLGAMVVIFSSDDLTGTSNAVNFDIGGLPEAIRPSGNRMLVCMARDGVDGDVFAVATVQAAGTIAMLQSYEQDVLGSATVTTNAWANAGTKGLIGGFTIMYPK